MSPVTVTGLPAADADRPPGFAVATYDVMAAPPLAPAANVIVICAGQRVKSHQKGRAGSEGCERRHDRQQTQADRSTLMILTCWLPRVTHLRVGAPGTVAATYRHQHARTKHAIRPKNAPSETGSEQERFKTSSWTGAYAGTVRRRGRPAAAGRCSPSPPARRPCCWCPTRTPWLQRKETRHKHGEKRPGRAGAAS